MSAARQHFIGRVEAIRTILKSPISTDTSPVPVPNSAAVAVRNGSMVMLFCALEAFIRDRSLECARRIDQTIVPYSQLPPGLKYALLVGSFEGLLHQTKYWAENEKIIEFEKSTISTSAGALGSAYQFTEYSFARDKSNVSADDIREIAKSFNVENFWGACPGVWVKVGSAAAPNADAIYRSLSKERHKAAHVSTHIVTHSVLTDFIPQAVAIAIAFDFLVSTGTHILSTSAITPGVTPAKITASNISCYTVKEHSSSKWAAFKPGSAKAVHIKPTQEEAFTAAFLKAQSTGAGVVRLDATNRPVAWNTVIG